MSPIWTQLIRVRHGGEYTAATSGSGSKSAATKGGDVGEDNPRLMAFEARLAELRRTMEAGLGDRAARIEGHLQNLAGAPAEAREGLRQEAHKLRGVAGTFGHAGLGEHAAALEQIALTGTIASVMQLAASLVAAVRAAVTPTTAAPTLAAVSSADVPAAVSRVSRVLAVDDDPETRALLALTLRQMGRFDAVIVDSGASALDHLARERFDLVLCDAMMPDMNGLTLCQRARQLETDHRPPIVILSAATADELGWNIDSEHAPFSWWQKPFKPKHLVEQINAVLAGR